MVAVRLVGRPVVSFALCCVEHGGEEAAVLGIDRGGAGPAPVRELIGVEIEQNKFVDVDSPFNGLAPDVRAIVREAFGLIIIADGAEAGEILFVRPEHHAQRLLCHGTILSLVCGNSNVTDAGTPQKGLGRGFHRNCDMGGVQ